MVKARVLALLAGLSAVLLSDSAQAQKRFEEEEEEDPSLVLNRAEGQGGDFF